GDNMGNGGKGRARAKIEFDWSGLFCVFTHDSDRLSSKGGKAKPNTSQPANQAAKPTSKGQYCAQIRYNAKVIKLGKNVQKFIFIADHLFELRIHVMALLSEKFN
ncbi:unnamed protein product, partial [Dovyalis caffra]